METTTLRRATALLAASAVLASLTVATVAAPTTAARPKCGGRVATIVGTNKSETIRGTAKADVIVAKGGDDIIRGRGGADRICGNGGKDRLYGQAGRDRLYGKLANDKLFGGGGADILKGQAGNDRLDGGAGIDTCLQGAGTGRIIDCESTTPPTPPPGPAPSADLSVKISGPNAVTLGTTASYGVTVTNDGPAASAYALSHKIGSTDASCTEVQAPSGAKASLAPGASRAHSYKVSCTAADDSVPPYKPSSTLTVTVKPSGGPVDPRANNDKADKSTKWTP